MPWLLAISSQSDYRYVTDKISLSHLATIPVLNCNMKIKALTEKGSLVIDIFQILLSPRACLALTFTLWQNHSDKITGKRCNLNREVSE